MTDDENGQCASGNGRCRICGQEVQSEWTAKQWRSHVTLRRDASICRYDPPTGHEKVFVHYNTGTDQ